MTLKSRAWPVSINTSSGDLIEDFFVPALSLSVQYDRGVGYFSSGWLRMVAMGMVRFAENGGRARWVTSPILSVNDWEALKSGEDARDDPILLSSLSENISDLATSLQRDTRNALAWMVADRVLTFKLALPHRKLAGGDFHDKFGIFTDSEGNQISFNGSYNESVQGIRNYESLKVFSGWNNSYSPLVEADRLRFEMLWNDQDPNVRIFDLPTAAREQILRLRIDDRPYEKPSWVKRAELLEKRSRFEMSRPILPNHIELRDYQREGIDAWFANGCIGLLEMATGTGKTITALASSAELFEKESRLAIIVAAPYQHLVDQWNDEATQFSYSPILAYKSKSRWFDPLNHAVLEFNGGYRNFISVITTHTTFISPEFQETIARLEGPSLLIADEVHHLGAERSRENYPANIPYRLALSATPNRWFDEVGTRALRNYFGDTVFSFPLEKAIGVCLTPYYYYPHLVPLTFDEMVKYEALSAKIAKVYGNEDDESQDILKKLLIKRARLLNTAENKIVELDRLIELEDDIKHTLFYCAPKQIDIVLRLLGLDKGLLVHRFTAEEDNRQRRHLLNDFSNGNLQGLVAMKCLDEGVDVPQTRTAYLLASSSNPREFIQRRGRILRKAPEKKYSIVHDLIAVPPDATSGSSAAFNAERSIIRKELNRFNEFANSALNKFEALDVIWDMADHYDLLDF